MGERRDGTEKEEICAEYTSDRQTGTRKRGARRFPDRLQIRASEQERGYHCHINAEHVPRIDGELTETTAGGLADPALIQAHSGEYQERNQSGCPGADRLRP